MFPYAQPKNPNDALRQIRTAERVKEMTEGEDYFWYNCGNGLHGVARRRFDVSRDAAYALNMQANPPTCTCPDFQKHGDFCKHTVYLWEQLEDEVAEAQARAFEEQAEGLAFTEFCAIDGELRGSYGVEF